MALALSGLLVFPFYFLRSFAYAGIPVSLLAAVASVTVLPALLKVLGPRIDSLPVLRRRKTQTDTGFWYRTAKRVMRFPVPVGAVGVIIPLALGAPFLDLKMTLADERVLPSSASSYQVGQAMRERFASQQSQAEMVVMRKSGPTETGPQGHQ
ncbi:MMPL family transporter [Streptomyces sp. NPDC019990]|uniref:MMPL family transporter n=1 Tax=Streptomyces sp. NPDC019990 TaxID=3154693 RepID=UPI0033F2F902